MPKPKQPQPATFEVILPDGSLYDRAPDAETAEVMRGAAVERFGEGVEVKPANSPTT